VVIESAMDSQKGPLATLLVTKGILQEGNIVATNRALGNLRNLADFQGKPLKAAGPGEPVLVLGFEEPPAVGEIFQVFANRAAAQEQIKGPRECLKQLRIESSNCVKILNIILKTDVLGSCEAIIGILKNIPHDKVVLRFLKTEVGDINASDVLLAEQTSAKIFGFRVKIDEKTNVLARQREVKIKIFDIIYELSQEARKAMTAVLSPETKRKDLAKFKTMIIFKQDKDEQIIGGRVLDGELVRNVKAEIIRDEAVIGIGRIRGLQKDKKDIGKAEKGQEVGILFQSEFPAQENDILVAFSEEKEKATL